MDTYRIEETKDGSATLYVPGLDEHYHSTFGALTESQHIFIEKGIAQCPAAEPRVLEVGMGTGLNAVLTAIWARDNARTVHYWGYELYPLPAETVRQLKYPSIISDHDAADYLEQIHGSPWGGQQTVGPQMQLYKRHENILEARFDSAFDVVYFDAFAPNKQEDIWAQELFCRIAEAMAPGAVLTTYCCKGDVKRMLRAAGLTVKKVPGPPGGKREILNAFKL